jgi:hypothetical protein
MVFGTSVLGNVVTHAGVAVAVGVVVGVRVGVLVAVLVAVLVGVRVGVLVKVGVRVGVAVGGAVVISRHQPLPIVPVLPVPVASSTIYKLQTPFGSVPSKTDSVVPYGPAGAGLPKVSPVL